MKERKNLHMQLNEAVRMDGLFHIEGEITAIDKVKATRIVIKEAGNCIWDLFICLLQLEM